MKRYVNPIPDGGAPLHNNRINSELQNEIWDVIKSLMIEFDNDTFGVIMKGLTFTNNAGNFDVTDGIVYIDGEFLRFPAYTNQTFPKFIVKKTPSYTVKTFADGVARNLVEILEAEMVGAPPGVGQYIQVNSLTSASIRRYEPVDWTNLTLIDGWVSATGATVQYRYNRIMGTVELRGQLDASGSGGAAFTNIGNLPGTPRYDNIRKAIVMDNAGLTSIRISSTAVQVNGGEYSTARKYDLSGIMYPVIFP